MKTLQKSKIGLHLVSNGEKYNFLNFPLIMTGETCGYSTSIQIDSNIYNNIKKEIVFAKKYGIEFTNLEEVYNICRDVLNWSPKKTVKKQNLLINHTKTYLMKNRRNGFYKIGRSNDPKKRERTLQSEEPDIVLVKVWDKNIENNLHRNYNKQRLRGEWFDLSKIQVRYICTKY